MTKMAVMPIYDRNLWKSSSHEVNGRWPWNLLCSIMDSGSTKFVQTMTPGWPFYSKFKFGHGLLYGEKANSGFLEAVVAYDIKVDSCNQLHIFINTKGGGYLLTFVLVASDLVFLSSAKPTETKLHVEHLFGWGEWKFVHGIWVTWSRWPWTLLCTIGYSDYQVCSNGDPWLTMTYFTATSDLATYAFVWENGKTVDLCEAVVAYDIQSWYMLSPKWIFITTKGQGHLLTFVLDVSDSVFLSPPLKLLDWLKPNYMWSHSGMKVCSWDFGQMIKIFAMPIYGKNPLKSFFSGLERPKPWNLVCNIGTLAHGSLVILVTPIC